MSAEFRVGRSVGRTIYQGDKLVGLMDTPELAERAVAAMNQAEVLNDPAVRDVILRAANGLPDRAGSSLIADVVLAALRGAK